MLVVRVCYFKKITQPIKRSIKLTHHKWKNVKYMYTVWKLKRIFLMNGTILLVYLFIVNTIYFTFPFRRCNGILIVDCFTCTSFETFGQRIGFY